MFLDIYIFLIYHLDSNTQEMYHLLNKLLKAPVFDMCPKQTQQNRDS